MVKIFNFTPGSPYTLYPLSGSLFVPHSQLDASFLLLEFEPQTLSYQTIYITFL